MGASEPQTLTLEQGSKLADNRSRARPRRVHVIACDQAHANRTLKSPKTACAIRVYERKERQPRNPKGSTSAHRQAETIMQPLDCL